MDKLLRYTMTDELSYADEIYREHIMDHYKHPRNFGVLIDADIRQRELNSLCGDEMEFNLKLDSGNKIVEDVRFIGRGCAISMASASILSEEIKGKSLAEINGIKNESIVNMLGISIGPVRYKCAILSLMTVKAGIQNHLNKK